MKTIFFLIILISLLGQSINAHAILFPINQGKAAEEQPIEEPVRTYPLPYVKPDYKIDIISFYRSKRTKKNNVEIYLSHKGFDPYACEKTKINHKFVLDKSDKRNLSFLNRARVNRWYSVTLACPEQPMNSIEKAKSSNYAYSNNCYIIEFKSSKRPPENSVCYSSK